MNNVKYYISLVGKNPMPNYISALNFCNKDTIVYLVYTEGSKNNISTKNVAINIKTNIEKKINNIKVILKPCNKSDSTNIEDVANDILDEVKKESKECYKKNIKPKIILDYTGGTKSMAAIFVNIFEIRQKENDKADFSASYMAKTGKCIYETSFKFIDEEKNVEREEVSYNCEQINGYNEITVDDIINLHGYELVIEDDTYKLKNNDGYIFNGYKGIVIYKILLDELKLQIYFKVECQQSKVKELVDKYFYIKDISEKIGGTEVEINIIVKNLLLDQTNIKEFEENISNISSNEDISEKVKLIMESEE